MSPLGLFDHTDSGSSLIWLDGQFSLYEVYRNILKLMYKRQIMAEGC